VLRLPGTLSFGIPPELRLAQLAILLVCAGCAQAHSDVEPTSAALEKIPAAVQNDLAAGLPRDVLVELDESALPPAAQSGDAGTVGAIGQDLSKDLGTPPPPAFDPLIAAAVTARAEAYRTAQNLILSQVDPTQVELLFQYQNLPLLFVRIHDQAGAFALANRADVLRLHEERTFQHQLAESLPLIHQPSVAAAGKTGSGTAVAVLDTGCDYTRSAFGTCSAPGVSGCKVAYAADFAADDGSRDDNGHGTNVSAIVLGVAPDTKVLALDVFTGAGAYSSTILSAIDWVIQNRAKYNIVALNMSLGGGSFTSACSTDVFAGAISNARAAGVLSAVASGNDGTSNALASPACAPSAISVGAVYDSNLGGIGYANCSDPTTAADKITCFSNSASFLSVLAPGALINAGGFIMAGTSQASPHVAGAIAVVRGAFPNETVDNSVARIVSNGPSITDPRNNVTKHRLDLAAAINGAAQPDKTGPTGSVTINANAPVTGAVAVSLNITGSDPSGVATMCASNTSTCVSFVPFATTRTWSLLSGDGIKTVWVVLKDGAGNISSFTDTITLDTAAPTGGTLSVQASDKAALLKWTAAADAGSGIVAYKLVVATGSAAPSCSVASSLYMGPGLSFSHTGLVNGTTYAYHLCPIDGAGNLGLGSTITARPIPEHDAPRGSVAINAGALATNSTTVSLTLAATDASGVASMCVSNTATCTSWLPFATSRAWTLAVANGSATVSVWFKDSYDNASSAPVTAAIKVDSIPPSGGTFDAAAISGGIRLSWTAASDASGIASYKLVFQAGTTAPASCSVGSIAYSGTALTYVHSPANKGSYAYRLCAIDTAGNVALGLTRVATRN
jgi:hypothetical protein